MNMDERVYWVWLQQAFGAGSSKPNRILRDFSSPREFYEAGEAQWRLEGYFTERELASLCAGSLEAAAAQLDFCEKVGQHVITPDDVEYPVLLKEIHNPPCVLYVKGELPDFDALPTIAVVGTRKATASGIAAASGLAHDLAKSGIIIVSGGALGIDTAAHQGALRAGGKTVCVLGCGIDYRYLMSNASMRECIAQNGALVSEYPPQTPALSTNFPIRNRIISGLALGTLVVEAAEKSGSLITAKMALEQNRDVFAVPCGITNPVSAGANALLKDGAKPVTCARDILEEYENRFAQVKSPSGLEQTVVFHVPPEENLVQSPEAEPAQLPEGLSKEAQLVYNVLEQVPQSTETLLQNAELPLAALLAALTELELFGLVQAHSGQRYSIFSS